MTDPTIVERSRTIPATPDAILPLLVDFHRWREWSPWEALDPHLERTYSGSVHGVGAVYEWSGNRKAGAGRMEGALDVAPQAVAIDLLFTKPFKAHNRLEFALQPAADGATTRVVWRLVSPQTFSSRIMGLFMSLDKMVGGDLERGLVQLEAAVSD